MSPYSVFGGNPIVNVDTKGDTSIFLNEHGEAYKNGTVYDKGSMEIYYMSRAQMVAASHKINQLDKDASFDEKRSILRSSSMMYIDRDLLNEFEGYANETEKDPGKYEIGGLLYVKKGETRANLLRCVGCKTGNDGGGRSIDGVSDISNYPELTTQLLDESYILGTWHTHPYLEGNACSHKVPSGVNQGFSCTGGGGDMDMLKYTFYTGSSSPYMLNKYSFRLSKGIGIIAYKGGINAYRENYYGILVPTSKNIAMKTGEMSSSYLKGADGTYYEKRERTGTSSGVQKIIPTR